MVESRRLYEDGFLGEVSVEAEVGDVVAEELLEIVTGAARASLITPVAAIDRSLEGLVDNERACFEFMRDQVQRRGLVRLGLDVSEEEYVAALKNDKMAGLSWEEDISPILLGNNAELLKKCAELSRLTGYENGEGTIIVGVDEKGKLFIRQRSSEVVNARWRDVKRFRRPELRLLFHPEAMARKTGKWADTSEILRAVEEAGYHLPVDVSGNEKRGLVAAWEALRGQPYVAGSASLDYRQAMLSHPEGSNGSEVRVVCSGLADGRGTFISETDPTFRWFNCGAILWLKGGKA